MEALRRTKELAHEGENARKGRWKARAEELSREVQEATMEASRHRQVVEGLQLKLSQATEEGAAMEAALEALHRQRERERAMGEAPKPVPPASSVVMTPVGLVTVPLPGSGSGALASSGPASPVGGGGGATPAPALQGYGGGWLMEAQQRQVSVCMSACASAMRMGACAWEHVHGSM